MILARSVVIPRNRLRSHLARLPVRGKMFRFEKILVFDEALLISFRYSGCEKD